MIQKLAGPLLALLLIAAGLAWWRTAPPSPKVLQERASNTSASLVDESTYATAQRLAILAATPPEQTFAEAALRIADHELALAFTAALRDVEAHPPRLSSEALKIQDQLTKSQGLLAADQQRVAQLTDALAHGNATQKDALQDELELGLAQLDLDKDEVEEANQDLVAAGGNPQQRLEAMIQEHDAQVKARVSTVAVPRTAEAPLQRGALMRLREWLVIRQKIHQLADAREAADQRAAALTMQRVALATSLDDAKGGISELANHTKTAKAAQAGEPAQPGHMTQPVPPAPAVAHSHEDAQTLLNQTKLITASQKVLTLLDRQSTDQRQLARVYQQWSAVTALQSSALVHTLLLEALIVIGILLAVLLLDRWVQHLLSKPKLDRRQVETLRSILRASLRVLAVLIILLILIGVPSQLGTMIGIVGAGLTVALKDFIVAFFGWLMLMGRNGIRLGDWVEINGVSGEVIELGMFHTVMLETGNWSDAGHPTGRRVTFTNSFAIEGHYFNFSTSGQWLWDELQVVVPAGQDPYPIVDAITHRVTEATAESARLAEQEWQRAVPAQRGKTFSGTPGVAVKPVIGGVEIAVRYITRANERFQLRAELYQAAVDLLARQKPTLAGA
jgi:small-conductance mechanosensitive channel